MLYTGAMMDVYPSRLLFIVYDITCTNINARRDTQIGLGLTRSHGTSRIFVT